MTNIDGIGETPNKTERFNDIAPLQYRDVWAQLSDGTNCEFLEIGIVGSDIISVAEARALYEWLGKALP
jgi:hypothetical protein